MDAKYLFLKAFGGHMNFMTPRYISRGMLGKRTAYELSSGRGFENDTIYGVTVVRQDPITGIVVSTTDSTSFSSRAEAERYISRLKSKYRGER